MSIEMDISAPVAVVYFLVMGSGFTYKVSGRRRWTFFISRSYRELVGHFFLWLLCVIAVRLVLNGLVTVWEVWRS